MIKSAQFSDLSRWKSFLKVVRDDFYGLDLSKDERHIEGVKENILRGTALYIENDEEMIIGALTYSKEKERLTWLAVHPEYRRHNIAKTLVENMIGQMPNAKCNTVKTFIDDNHGVAARSFYQSLGFIPGEIIHDTGNRNAGHSMQVFKKPMLQDEE